MSGEDRDGDAAFSSAEDTKAIDALKSLRNPVLPEATNSAQGSSRPRAHRAEGALSAPKRKRDSSNPPTNSDLKFRRRMRKNTREKQRRSELNDKFEYLNTMLPLGPKAKMEKFAILSEAVNLIHTLQADVKQLTSEKATLESKMDNIGQWLNKVLPGVQCPHLPNTSPALSATESSAPTAADSVSPAAATTSAELSTVSPLLGNPLMNYAMNLNAAYGMLPLLYGVPSNGQKDAPVVKPEESALASTLLASAASSSFLDPFQSQYLALLSAAGGLPLLGDTSAALAGLSSSALTGLPSPLLNSLSLSRQFMNATASNIPATQSTAVSASTDSSLIAPFMNGVHNSTLSLPHFAITTDHHSGVIPTHSSA